MTRRLRLLLVAVLAAVAVGGCRVDVNVAVDVEDDGGGVVRVAVGLDDDAMGRVPDLEDQLVLDDLTERGWQITGPAREDDGRTWVRASKRFETPAEATVVMREISGEDGPFRGFRVVHDRSFLRTEWHFEGAVDLSAGLDDFSDDALRSRLDGTSFGAEEEELARRAEAALDEVFGFQVAALLPGEVTSNAPVEVTGGAIWRPSLGEQVSLQATGGRWNIALIGWTAAAALAALACIVLVVVRVRRWRADRRLDATPAAGDADQRPAAGETGGGPEAAEGAGTDDDQQTSDQAPGSTR